MWMPKMEKARMLNLMKTWTQLGVNSCKFFESQNQVFL